MASHNNDLELVNKLLAHPKIDVNRGRSWGDGANPLWVASYYGYVDIVEALLVRNDTDVHRVGGIMIERGVRTDIRSLATPLNVACKQGNVDVVRALVDHPRIDVNRGSPRGAIQ